MKKYILLSISVVVSFFSVNGQVLSNGNISSGLQGENVFLDAAHNFNAESNRGKGLVFPTVDLVNFEFILNGYVADDFTFEHYFNGMIVYNTTTGKTKTTGNRSSTAIDVVPGFYYFSNPQGHINQNVTDGKWLPLGNSATYTTNGSNGKDTLFVTNQNGSRDTVLLGELGGGGVTISLTKDTLFIINENGGIDTVYCGGGITTSLTKDTLFIRNPNGGIDTVLINSIDPDIIIEGISPITTEVQDKTVKIKLDGNPNDGDILVFNAEENKWMAQPLKRMSGEHIWLPAINLPWNITAATITVDLFKIYQQSFAPKSGTAGVPKLTGGGIEPAHYGGVLPGNYVSSEHGVALHSGNDNFRSLGRESDTSASFEYIVTYFDNNSIEILGLDANGILTYKPKEANIMPPTNTFINVLLIRK